MDLVYAYVAVNNAPAALDVLKQAVANKDAGMLYMKVDPFLGPLRGNQEFRSLLLQTGL
jgi:hypothetical protein